MYIELKETKVKQYATSHNADGSKRYSSGKLEIKDHKDLVGKPVYVRVKTKEEERTFISKVKNLKINKFEVQFVSSTLLKELIGNNVDADIIEIE